MSSVAYDEEAMALPVNEERWCMRKEGILRRTLRLTASESLENGLLDDTVVVDLDLQLHDIATCRSAHETSSDIEILLVERADLLRREMSV